MLGLAVRYALPLQLQREMLALPLYPFYYSLVLTTLSTIYETRYLFAQYNTVCLKLKKRLQLKGKEHLRSIRHLFKR